MIERVHHDLGLWPRKLIADTGYGSAEMLAWLVHERDIHPHIPVVDADCSAVTAPSSVPTSPMTSTRTITPARRARC